MGRHLRRGDLRADHHAGLARVPVLSGVGANVVAMGMRRCSRAGCPSRAVATLTYVYADSQAVLGPLATQAEPHGYDLCGGHAHSLSVPRGWEVIRLANGDPVPPTEDDLLALADAVREVGLSYDAPGPAQVPSSRPHIIELRRRGHLTVLADPDA